LGAINLAAIVHSLSKRPEVKPRDGTLRRDYKRWLPWAASALAVLFVQPSAERLAHFDNFRWALLDQAPLLGRGVEFASLFQAADTLETGDNTALTSMPPGGGTSDGPSAQKLENGDVLLVTVDALRADHVSAYGYGRKTTPHFDALAQTGVRFDRDAAYVLLRYKPDDGQIHPAAPAPGAGAGLGNLGQSAAPLRLPDGWLLSSRGVFYRRPAFREF
jgi:hypothetical protein